VLPLAAAKTAPKLRILQTQVCSPVVKFKRLLSAAITISPGLQIAAMLSFRKAQARR
jgi:hypothetical protein